MNSAWFVVLVSMAPFGSGNDQLLTKGFMELESCQRMAIESRAQLVKMNADKEYTVICRKLQGT